MYKRILIPLEHTAYDEAILNHVRELARMMGSVLVLLHVADGWAARYQRQLNLRESEEMQGDKRYIEELCAGLELEGFKAEAILAIGDPAQEIARAAKAEHCDLIAMSTHGHRFIKDLFYGSVANTVRHISRTPVLLVRGVPRPR